MGSMWTVYAAHVTETAIVSNYMKNRGALLVVLSRPSFSRTTFFVQPISQVLVVASCLGTDWEVQLHKHPPPVVVADFVWPMFRSHKAR